MKIEPNDSVEVRAVKGVLGGWVCGDVSLARSEAVETADGGAYAFVRVWVSREDIDKMLANEKKKAKAKR